MALPLRRLLEVGPRGWRDLLTAQAALLRARRRLRRDPIGSFVVRETSDPGPPSGDPLRARELARAVERTATFGIFRPFCLVRAIAICDVLSRENIRGSTVRIGVRRHGGEFAAHAWVRWGEEILGDRADHVATFTEVDDIHVLGRQ